MRNEHRFIDGRSARWRFSLGCAWAAALIRLRMRLSRPAPGTASSRTFVFAEITAAICLASYGLLHYPQLRSDHLADLPCRSGRLRPDRGRAIEQEHRQRESRQPLRTNRWPPHRWRLVHHPRSHEPPQELGRPPPHHRSARPRPNRRSRRSFSQRRQDWHASRTLERHRRRSHHLRDLGHRDLRERRPPLRFRAPSATSTTAEHTTLPHTQSAATTSAADSCSVLVPTVALAFGSLTAHLATRPTKHS